MEQKNLCGTTVSMLGYGCMRFPTLPDCDCIDEELATVLIDQAYASGITYYDTAIPYHGGDSEAFLGRTLAKYPRESYQLATKLPCWQVSTPHEAEEMFLDQLWALNTDYVDYYLFHSLTGSRWDKVVEQGILSVFERLQQEGKIRHLGFSFHDSYDAFEHILLHRTWDFCQIQLNYMDVNHQAGLRGLALAQSVDVPVIVMEPVKGGSLAILPDAVMGSLRPLNPTASDASWALRWVGSQSGVALILSGMSTAEQLMDNLATFSPLVPLSAEEMHEVTRTATLLKSRINNGCTACGYCMPCPAGVNIPANFTVWNTMAMYENRRFTAHRLGRLDADELATLCHGCGKCEQLCPQHLSIRDDLRRLAEEIPQFIGATE